MLSIIGIVVVFLGVVGGYLIAGGHLHVLFQPAELVIIGGAAVGAMLIGTPTKTMKNLVADLPKVFKSGAFTKDHYIALLGVLYNLGMKMRREGILALESDISEPENSAIFKNYPKFLENHHALEFFKDTARLIVDAAAAPSELEMIMENDIEAHHEEAFLSPSTLSTMGDALPGLGIVAAVMGVVITMGYLDQPAEVIGHHVAAALVGTFLGILLSYGLVQPLASNLTHYIREEGRYFTCMKIGLKAMAESLSPMLVVEYVRRSIYVSDRPSAEEVEKMLKG
ncbi:MAG: flagellar motor stator protein MotA [Nitrospirota bacterium]|nr:flagellar motor stator protein MotA [Nitrospirota bacterium]